MPEYSDSSYQPMLELIEHVCDCLDAWQGCGEYSVRKVLLRSAIDVWRRRVAQVKPAGDELLPHAKPAGFALTARGSEDIPDSSDSE